MYLLLVKVLKKTSGSLDRKITEGLFIQKLKPELNTLVITDHSNCSDRSFPLILGHAIYVRTWPFRDTTWSAILHRTEINSENPEENKLNGSLDRKITEELFIQKLKPELNNKYRQLSVENFLV